MPEYRAYVLDEHDHILFSIEIVEEDLSAAVHLGSAPYRAMGRSFLRRPIH
jgi:hypothetical protein